MNQKNNYKFYLSYWESYKALTTDKEKTEFVEIINKVHFFEEHIERIKPKNANVKLLFASIKHSLQSSIQGFCDKKGIDYNSLFENNNLNNPKQAPSQGGIKGGYQAPSQEIIINNKQQEINNKKYSFEGKVIKLNKDDFEKWQSIYNNLDLNAELYSRDIWLNNQADSVKKNWFMSTPTFFAKINQERKPKQVLPKVIYKGIDPEPEWES